MTSVRRKQAVKAKWRARSSAPCRWGIGMGNCRSPPEPEVAALDAQGVAGGGGKRVEKRGGGRAAQQAEEGAGAGGALPEHAEQERGEQRRVHKAKHQLDDVHGVGPLADQVGATDAQADADHRDEAAHPGIMLRRSCWARCRPGRGRRSRSVLKAVTLPAMPDMKEASSPVNARPSRPVGQYFLTSERMTPS